MILKIVMKYSNNSQIKISFISLTSHTYMPKTLNDSMSSDLVLAFHTKTKIYNAKILVCMEKRK